MKLAFDLTKVTFVEFGVGRDDGNGQTFVAVPVGVKVQEALREMAQATWDAIQQEEGGPTKYEPSDKHGGVESLYLPLADDLAAGLRDLHRAGNLPMDAAALSSPAHVFC